MIDTLRNKIDVVRSLGERVSLLRLRNRSYILVENRRDRVSERTDRLIPLPPCFGWQECLAAFHAQALQLRKQPEQIHYLRGDGIEHVRFLHGDYHVFRRMGQKRSCFRRPCLYRTKKELLIIR